VFNSPATHHEEFIARALEVASAAVAVIVPIPFLCGQERYWQLYRPCPSSYVFCCSQRPSMPPGGTDIPAQGGTTDYCWLIWARRALYRFRDPRVATGTNGWWCSPHGTVTDWLEPIVPLRQKRAEPDTAVVAAPSRSRRAKKHPDAVPTAPG